MKAASYLACMIHIKQLALLCGPSVSKLEKQTISSQAVMYPQITMVRNNYYSLFLTWISWVILLQVVFESFHIFSFL